MIRLALTLVVAFASSNVFAQASTEQPFIAVDYCPSEKDVLLPFYDVYGPQPAATWEKCAEICESTDPLIVPVIHIPNTYCQYYESGGDGTCEIGRSFDNVWQQCMTDGPTKCMGVMWNSCKGPTSDITVNGAWKLMKAGQDVGDADNPTDTCGGRKQAVGHWDVFLRGDSHDCQFAYYNGSQCYLYGRRVTEHDPLLFEPFVFQSQECKTNVHGSGGKYVLREFQYATQYGKDVPVGALGHKLRQTINEETSNGGAFHNNMSMDTPFIGKTWTRYCDNSAWFQYRGTCTNACSGQKYKARQESGCGETEEGSIKVLWTTSLDALYEPGDMTVGEFWGGQFKENVMDILNKISETKGYAYDSLDCGDCCDNCDGGRGPPRIYRTNFSSLGYKSEMMPSEMDYKLVRYKNVEVTKGEVVDIIAHFKYKIDGMDTYEWDQSVTGSSYCSTGGPAISATMGVFALMLAPLGIGPVFGVLGLMNTVACIASATAPAPAPTPSTPSPSPSCMSGKTGVTLVSQESSSTSEESLRISTSNSDTIYQIAKVKDLKMSNTILGLDENKQTAKCTVEAVGSFGHGPVYGNYTDGHYVLNPNSGMVERHGTNQTMSIQDKYIVLTSCPLGVDESGVGFTPFDSDFFGEMTREMTWKDYLLLHTAILRIVRDTGAFWFDGSSYEDLDFLHAHAPIMGKTLLQCMKNHSDCKDLEDASMIFIERALAEPAKKKAHDAFQNIGRHRELGSASAIVSAGKSVME